MDTFIFICKTIAPLSNFTFTILKDYMSIKFVRVCESWFSDIHLFTDTNTHCFHGCPCRSILICLCFFHSHTHLVLAAEVWGTLNPGRFRILMTHHVWKSDTMTHPDCSAKDDGGIGFYLASVSKPHFAVVFYKKSAYYGMEITFLIYLLSVALNVTRCSHFYPTHTLSTKM